MAKIIGPLFSIAASGTIGNAITYGFNQSGAWVRGVYKKLTTSLPSQLEVRKWFSDVIDYFKEMGAEEKFLWALVVKNSIEYNRTRIKQSARSARCHLSHWILSTRTFIWEGSPFPPELIQWIISDDIPGLEQMKSDLEKLTALGFKKKVDVYLFPYLGEIDQKAHPGETGVVIGLCNSTGIAIALKQSYWESCSPEQATDLLAHELTHAIMDQNGWHYVRAVIASETIADECAERIVWQELEPVYKYKGKTLAELIAEQNK